MVTPMYLGRVLNSVLFNCVSTPGLADVLLELLSFEGVGLRCRVASELKGIVDRTIEECAFVWDSAIVLGYPR